MAVKQLRSDTARELMENVEHFLIDMDGVLWDVNGVINGGQEAVSLLQTKNKKIYFITNNIDETQEGYHRKLKHNGFNVTLDTVFSASQLPAQYLKDMNFQGTAYVAASETVGIDLDKQNIKHIGTGPDYEGIHDSRLTWVHTKLDLEIFSIKERPTTSDCCTFDVTEWKNGRSCDILYNKHFIVNFMPVGTLVRAVIVGYDNYFSSPKILKAASYIQREDTIFLAISEDNSYPGSTDIIIPDNAAMVEAVKVMAKKEPIVLGKPSKVFFDLIQKHHDLDPSKCCIIGDSLRTDIALARTCGIWSLLVLSGNTTQGDLDQLTSDESDLPRPDYYTTRLGDLCSLLS